ncbi:jacalin-related lectin 3-like [Cornus florida]|uniref:jacalin-related lectin 3-like n=1 Tax=Cornus florida TaxID=4283 RepID=UPI00289D4B9F|nr:jacalin-related lectin 3-like [Cornus florida]
MADGQKVVFGPYGGTGGNSWDHGSYNATTIRELRIRTESNHLKSDIISLHICYDIEGKAVWGTRYGGGTSKGATHVVKLNYPTEYFISISGYHSSGSQYVNSLTFQSNIRHYGPYGVEKGTSFVTPITAGKIVGFFGRAGDYIDSIGVYVKPLPVIITVGPFGTTGGQQWDDGTFNNVRELIIHAGALIDSIQVVYDDVDGNLVSGENHGTVGGAKFTVKLDQDEFLLSFWGYYGQVADMVVIRSLGFQSNKRTIGPFGVEEGEKFQSSSTRSKIIGFHGRSESYLSSIGAYLSESSFAAIPAEAAMLVAIEATIPAEAKMLEAFEATGDATPDGLL